MNYQHPCKECCPKKFDYDRMVKEYLALTMGLSLTIPRQYLKKIQDAMNDSKHKKSAH